MPPYPPLADLGPRIAILGPSNAGKSTLAVAMGEKLGVEPVHLDQLRHLPHTDWERRPDAEFSALHDEAIAAESWVMEGNYSDLFPQRFARATGAVVLGGNRWLRLGRYLSRTVSNRPRAGHLAGGRDSLKWEMVDWVLIRSPGHLRDHRRFVAASGLPHIRCDTTRDLEALYRAWALRAWTA